MKKELCRIIAVLTAVNTVFSSAVFAEEAAPVDSDETSIVQNLSVSEESEAVPKTEAPAENKVEDTSLQNAVNLYVDSNGGGENTYRSISQAISAAKSIDKTKNQVVINVKGGTYRLNQTIAL